ncbi:hypothetical protein [Herbaspirillum huttiense]|uniref:Uncharacterized protein n=2 Tax=Herbaspirillum huttiense TaxID=863372 RepID=A0AAJ2H8A5_9BURK|nr:hypothetical protein [Herbaspirillum huttiense]MDR9834255.1 hypothetical protein [Herbaspirillum huttiense]
MRRLLLLLLTLLIPLQLLAATGEVQLREQLREQLQAAAPVQLHAQAPVAAHHCAASAAVSAALHLPADLLASGSLSGDDQPAGIDDDDQPSAQGELEDSALPPAIATPGLHWFPFPHAFPASLSWSSYLRDQLRPPPLA